MARFFNVAMVQLSTDLYNLVLEARKAGEKAKIDRYLDTVLSIDPVVDLFVLPETIVCGFDPAHWTSLAETIPGPTSDYFCAKAQELGTWICPGSIIEKRAGVRGYLQHVPSRSRLRARSCFGYSKVFVPYPFDQSLRGNDFPVYEIPGVGKIGIMICADHAVPEVARNLAFNGAEIILNPTCQGIFIGGLRHRVPLTQIRAIGEPALRRGGEPSYARRAWVTRPPATRKAGSSRNWNHRSRLRWSPSARTRCGGSASTARSACPISS